MPLVKIEILKGKSEEYKKAVLDGVHQALVEVLGIPESDRFQRLYELHRENLEAPPDRTDSVTIIQVIMFKGRSNETKRNLYRSITEKLVKIQV